MKEEVKKQRRQEAEEETKPENKEKTNRGDLSVTRSTQNRSGFGEGLGVVEIRPHVNTVQVGKCEQAIGGGGSVHRVVSSPVSGVAIRGQSLSLRHLASLSSQLETAAECWEQLQEPRAAEAKSRGKGWEGLRSWDLKSLRL